MKKIISTLLVAFITIGAFAQKCKFDIDKKDAFTGKQTKGISAVLNKSWMVGFNRSDNAYTIGLLMEFPGAKRDVLSKGDTLMLALDGASPIVLTAIESATPTARVVDNYGGILSSYHVQYAISAEQMKVLAQKKCTAARVYFGATYFSLDVPEKNGQKVIEAANCITQ